MCRYPDVNKNGDVELEFVFEHSPFLLAALALIITVFAELLPDRIGAKYSNAVIGLSAAIAFVALVFVASNYVSSTSENAPVSELRSEGLQ